MDVRMPVMDGIEATKIIRQSEWGKQVKIIGVSAHVFKDEVDKILEVGMDDFIKKPFYFSDIYSSLQKHLGAKYTLYNMEDISYDQENIALTIEMLEKLDTDILLELKESIENLETERLHTLVERISLDNKNLSKIIHDYISNLKFTELFHLLNKMDKISK